MAVIRVASDSALCVIFGDEISEKINDRVRAFARAVEDARIPGVVETVPAYCAVTVHYAPERIGYLRLYERLYGLLETAEAGAPEPGRVLSVPVLYGGDHGPDLAFVARHAGLTEAEAVALHTAPDYRVYMLGFLPGFCYLGGLDERLHTPRLTTPRVRIPAGAVGIAGGQTGIYPLPSPGGWQLIGQTPLRLYDPHRETPILLEAGMTLRFYAVGPEEYEAVRRREYPEEYGEGGERL